MDVNQLITEHLDIWTSAIEKKSNAGRGGGGSTNLHGIKKLRELILELAVRGKLVSQNSSEESAKALLLEGSRRKTRGIEEKRFKKQNLGKPLKESEKPFDIPESWQWIQMGELGFIFNGNSVSSRDKVEKYGNRQGLPFIATKNVGYGFEPLDYDVDAWIPEGEPKFKVALANTPLICSEGGSAGKKCGVADRDVCFGNKLFACEFYGEFVAEYLLAWYQSPSFFSQFSERMTGIIGGISLAKFLRLPVPVPPVQEQRRIITKLNELMALCDALERQAVDSINAHQVLVETCLSTLKNSQTSDEISLNWARVKTNFDMLFNTDESLSSLDACMVELATEGLLLKNMIAVDGKSGDQATPCNWKRFPLLELLEFGPKNGLSPKAVDHETEIKVLTLTATTSGEFKKDAFKYVDIDRPDDDSEVWLKNGDILIQRANALQYVGVSALYNGPDNAFIYPDLMIKIRPSKKVIPEFLLLALQSQSTRKFFRENASGTSGSMPKINQGVLKRLQISLPTIEDQRLIVSYIHRFRKVCRQLKQNIHTSSEINIKLSDTLTSKFH